MLTSELDRDYIQELITLQDLKNNGMYRGEVTGLIQTINDASFKNLNSTGTISVKQSFFRSSRIMAPSKLPRPQQLNWSGVTIDKLLLWHGTVDYV